MPRKNIRPLAGKPLLAYTVEAARAAHSLARIVLSTDDEEIAEVGRRLGIEVPFLRPAELAQDGDADAAGRSSRDRDARSSRGDRFDAVCILQPTTPLRRPGLHRRLHCAASDSRVDAVVTMLPVPPSTTRTGSTFRMRRRDAAEHRGAAPIPRRQDLPPAFRREGSVYVSRRDIVMNAARCSAIVWSARPDPSACVDIDTIDEWDTAERMVRARAAEGVLTPVETLRCAESRQS